MNTRMPDADGTHRLGGIDRVVVDDTPVSRFEPTVTEATGGSHKLARKLLEQHRDQAQSDLTAAQQWLADIERDRANAERQLGESIAALAWLDDLEAGEQR